MTGPVLSTHGLQVGYPGRAVASGIHLQVQPGTLWVVLGPNGAGKTTLLRTLLGWLPALAGEVQLFGQPLASWQRRRLAQTLAWVPQSFEVEAGFTGLELVLMGRAPHLGAWGLPSHNDVQLARAALEELGISELANRRTDKLSGGEKRLLLLARALAQAPQVLLLDEPTAFLDLRHQVEVLRRVRTRVEGGLCAVAVLHDATLAARVATHVLLLSAGGVLGQGPAGEWLSAPRLASLYGVPMVEAVAEDGSRAFAPRWQR